MQIPLQHNTAPRRRTAMLGILATLLCLVAPAALSQPSPQKIVIGLIPEMNIVRQKERFKPLEEHLTRKLGIPVQFTILSRYGNIIDRFTSDRLDGAFLGSFTGALAIRKLGAIPLARPVNEDRTVSYRGYLFVRRDSGITGAPAMRGKRMAYVDRATTAGYLFPLAWLKENGVSSPEGFFGEQFFTGSHDAAVSAVLNGKADIGAAKNTVYEQLRKEDPRVDRELVILARSDWVPSNALCVRKDLDPKLRKALQNALVGLGDDPGGKQVLASIGALGFVETTAKDYETVFELARAAGIDIRTYRYRID